VLSSGAAAKETLAAQVEVCGRVRQQCSHIGDVIGEITQKMTGLS
jgi:hypothetical protein